MSKTGNHVVELQESAVTAFCRRCNETGEIYNSHDCMKECPDCKGTGEIQCDMGGLTCPFDDYCYCEAAWDRQQEQYGADAA